MKIEFRLNEMILEGYVNVTDRDSKILSSPRGKFVERIEAGAFGKALESNDNIKLTLNHLKVLGSTKTGEVELMEDVIGLKAAATITDPETIDLAKRGKLKGWSFSMNVNKDNWTDTGKGYQERSVQDLNLLEVSILNHEPAYKGTSIKIIPERLEVSSVRKWNSKTPEMLRAEMQAAMMNQLMVLEAQAILRAHGRTGKMRTQNQLLLEEIARLRTGGKT